MESFEKDTRGNQDKKTEDIYRITVGKAGERAVLELMEKANENFTAGQVNRMQVATWMLVKFAERVSAEDIRALRMDHINDVDMLEHLWRAAKDSGQVQPEVRDLLRKLLGADEARPKGSKKNLKNVINDDIKESEDI